VFAHLPDFTISREPLLYSWLRAPGHLKNRSGFRHLSRQARPDYNGPMRAA
jgi:hypothetical protein